MGTMLVPAAATFLTPVQPKSLGRLVATKQRTLSMSTVSRGKCKRAVHCAAAVVTGDVGLVDMNGLPQHPAPLTAMSQKQPQTGSVTSVMCLRVLGLRALKILVQQGRALEALGPGGSRPHKSRRMPGGSCACFASCRACAQAQPGCCLANSMRNFLP